MRVLGLIPARGGSKGVQRKNIRLLCGKPLLQYTAETALRAKLLSRIILTTDDEEIAQVGQRCGLDVPFLRPPELATDHAPMLGVVQYVLRALIQSGDEFDAICLLQPTTPLRKAQDIDACIDLLVQRQVDSVVTILPVPTHYNPHWVYFQDKQGHLYLSTGEDAPIMRRQDLPPAFYREGSIYVTRCQVVLEQNSLYGQSVIGYPINPDESVNIDTMDDWERAERLLGCK